MHARLNLCIGCIIAGIIITIIGLLVIFGSFPAASWEIMGNMISSDLWGWPFAIFGIILLLIGVILAFLSLKIK